MFVMITYWTNSQNTTKMIEPNPTLQELSKLFTGILTASQPPTDEELTNFRALAATIAKELKDILPTVNIESLEPNNLLISMFMALPSGAQYTLIHGMLREYVRTMKTVESAQKAFNQKDIGQIADLIFDLLGIKSPKKSDPNSNPGQ